MSLDSEFFPLSSFQTLIPFSYEKPHSSFIGTQFLDLEVT